LSQFTRVTDRRTDRQTNRPTEFPSLYRVCIPCSAVKMRTWVKKRAVMKPTILFQILWVC